MNIEYITNNQDWENEATEYFFDVSGVKYRLTESGGFFELTLGDGTSVNDIVLERKLINIVRTLNY